MVMNRLLVKSQSLCDPVLGDTKEIHAEYLDVLVHLGCGTKIRYVNVHCLP